MAKPTQTHPQPCPHPPTPLRVVVVGSGLAGLTTAYLLRKEGCRVYLIEKADTLGFYSSSVNIPQTKSGQNPKVQTWTQARDGEKSIGTRVDDEKHNDKNEDNDAVCIQDSGDERDLQQDEEWIVDVPMRSFQGGYYPLLISLYRHLGLTLIKRYYAYSFSHLPFSQQTSPSSTSKPSPTSSTWSTSPTGPSPSTPTSQCSQLDRQRTEVPQTYFIYSGASGCSKPALPSQYLSSPLSFLVGIYTTLYTAFGYFILIILSFLSWHNLLPPPLRPTTTAAATGPITIQTPITTLESLRIHRILQILGIYRFIDDIVIPVFSAVGTMTTTDVRQCRLDVLLEYAHTTLGTPHYVLGKGVTARDVAVKLVGEVKMQGKGHVRLSTEIVGFRMIRAQEDNHGRDQGQSHGQGWGRRREQGRREGDKEAAGSQRVGVEEIGIEVQIRGQESIFVDKVVLAAQPTAAKVLLGMMEGLPQGEEERVGMMRNALAEVDSRATIVLTHRDKRLLSHSPNFREINLTTPTLSIPGADHTSGLDPTPIASPPPPYVKKSRPSEEHGLRVNDETTPYFPPRENSIYTMGTHIIEPPVHLREKYETVLQTSNPVIPIDPSGVLGMARLERALPLRDPNTLSRLHPPGPKRIVHLVGAYAYPGIPLLEGCVGSARRCVREIMNKDAVGSVGGVDWSEGEGSWMGRIWRWRRAGVNV